MNRTFASLAGLVAVLFALAAGVFGAARTLDIYFIDTEGGQATLLVSPGGHTLLLDSGFADSGDPANPGKDLGRDANRIAAAAKLSGAKSIDYLVTTHFHSDHMGGIAHLQELMPVGTLLDHGTPNEPPSLGVYPADYAAEMAKSRHEVLKAGDKIPVKGLDVSVLISNGAVIDNKPEPNSFCAGLVPHQEPPQGQRGSEDPSSVGVVVQYGKFRFANLGDNTWNSELALLCPGNRMGRLDVLEAAHHGLGDVPTALYATAPRAVIVNNGARKGAGPAMVKAYQASPEIESLWQLHFNVPGGKDGNPPEEFVANMEEQNCPGQYIKVSAKPDGSFTVYNQRTGASNTYAARK